MSDADPWIEALRRSHDRFAGLVDGLDDARLREPSYDDDWSIAQVASHLGSQAEIFQLFLDAGLGDTPSPGLEQFTPIWEQWNTMSAPEQVGRSIGANEAFVSRVEGLAEEDRERFDADVFGGRRDLAGVLAMRLGEHAVHTWDVEVALHRDAVVAPEAVELLLGTLPGMVQRAGRGHGAPDEDADDDTDDGTDGGTDDGTDDPQDETFVVETTAPDRRWLLRVAAEVSLEDGPEAGDDALRLPAEAFLRLVYGRLDPDHTPDEVTGDDRLPRLREVFPGF